MDYTHRVVGDMRTPFGILPEYEMQSKDLLDYSIVMYGASGSGKTTVCIDILAQLRPFVEVALCISGSEDANGSYAKSGIFPEAFVQTNFNMPDTMEAQIAKPPGGARAKKKSQAAQFFEKLEMFQTEKVKIYKEANNMATFTKLIERMPDYEQHQIKSTMNKKRELINEYIYKIHKKFPDGEYKNMLLERIKESFEEFRIDCIKKYIRKYRDTFIKRGRLGDDEKIALHYIDFNPRMLLVIDDKSEDMADLCKEKSFASFFYRGRHMRTTFIIMAHDVTVMPKPEFRKNAFVSVFTDQSCAKSFFELESSRQDKMLVDKILPIIPYLFQNKYRKLIYLRLDQRRVFHYTAKSHKNFKFGSDAYWKLGKEIMEAIGRRRSAGNPFARQFAV